MCACAHAPFLYVCAAWNGDFGGHHLLTLRYKEKRFVPSIFRGSKEKDTHFFFFCSIVQHEDAPKICGFATLFIVKAGQMFFAAF